MSVLEGKCQSRAEGEDPVKRVDATPRSIAAWLQIWTPAVKSSPLSVKVWVWDCLAARQACSALRNSASNTLVAVQRCGPAFHHLGARHQRIIRAQNRHLYRLETHNSMTHALDMWHASISGQLKPKCGLHGTPKKPGLGRCTLKLPPSERS